MLGDMVKGIVHSDSIKGDIGVITRERQRNCLNQCIQSITNCLTVAEEGLVDLEAEELRNGLKALAPVDGRCGHRGSVGYRVFRFLHWKVRIACLYLFVRS